MADVTLEHVYKIYDGGVIAVRDVNLEIHDREFMVLVGPSGCGKSTCLRMVAGLEEISRGTVRIGERVVNDVAPKNRDIAMVFQNYALYPHMSVFENMAFGLRLRHCSGDEIARRVGEAADILGLEQYLDRLPKQLSGGQRQRVAVGRAIVRNPSAFLFDEPLSNLDAKMRVQMRTEISRLHSRLNATMIYVTHDQIEAMTMGNRICVMKDGAVQQVAPPLEIYEHPANRFVAGFIGTPPMNFLDGEVTCSNGNVMFRSVGFEFVIPSEWREKMDKYQGRRVVLGIRPEHIGGGDVEMADPPMLRAKVDLVEPMGAETYLYVSAGATTMVARVEPHRMFRRGDFVELPVLVTAAHIFDADSGLTVI